MTSHLHFGAVPEHLLGVLAELEPQRRMPDQVQAEVDDEVDDVGFLGIEKRHGVATTCPSLKPQNGSHAELLSESDQGQGRSGTTEDESDK